ncbi:hypothetical protein WME75_39880 [Sorangium sp. So ce1014]|uniref:hypothetical protein n=1 Tax=Sorangium sp. So ce1014 TaxID=3133326 RepID=UPI003F5E2AEA
MKTSTRVSVVALVLGLSFGAGCIASSGEEQASAQQQLSAAPGADGVWLSTEFSFGFCAGECITTVSRDGAALELKACTRQGDCRRSNSATLTDKGSRHVAEVEGALGGVPLDARYGCPDCADGGATRVSLQRDDLLTSHQYEYPNAPAPLENLDRLVKELKLGLDTCTPGPLLQLSRGCTPR